MSATNGAAPTAQGYGTPRYRAAVLAMLLLVYTFNFLDRQILGILAVPIKADLQLTDGQLGLLGGLAFAALYSTLAIPLALLADKTSRTWVITISLVVWSGFTALCGIATNFAQMLIYRIGVGVGEAGGVAPSYALISDYFPPHQRARALAIYSLGIPIGLAAGVLFGAWIAAAVDWRAAFIAVGLAGVVIAPFFRLIVKEPPRPVVAKPDGPGIGAVFGILARKRSFWLLAFAASMSSICGYGLAFWTSSFLVRSYGFDLTTTSYFFGSLLLIGGLSGVFAGGWLADRMGADKGNFARLPAYAWLITAPLFVAGFLVTDPYLAWALLVIPNGLNILWLGPINNAIQHLVEPRMRATASACFLMINNLIGLGLGSWSIGIGSDVLEPAFGNEALRYAMAAAACTYFVATALALLASKGLDRDWVDDAA
jgi:predicted MFS family arabinose efflux permease